MATLEKIRGHKKLLTIVIGTALFFFIITLVPNLNIQSMFGSGDTAAKVGSEKINIMDFQHRVEQTASDDQQNNQQIDAATRQQQVLDEMINEMLINQELEKLGVDVSDWEITQLTIGKMPAPAVMQFAQQAGAKSPAELYDFIMNPGKQGVQESQIKQLRNQWNQLTTEVVKQYKLAKLQSLLAGCMQANDLDRAQLAEEGAVTNVVTFAKKDYASVPDDNYKSKVTDAELKAEYEKLKPMFKIDEQLRGIHFIAVNIEPSQEDIAAADKVADAAYAALQKGRGVDSVRLLGTVKVDTAMLTQDRIPSKVRDLFTSAAVGTTHRDSTEGYKYTMYKLINKQVSLDSVMLSYVVVQGDAKMQKSVLDELNAGKSLDDLMKTYPQKVDGKLDDWQRLYTTPDSLKNKVVNATPGVYFVYNSGEQGATLLKVGEKKAPKTFYTLATVTYEAYASANTSDRLHDAFQAFLDKNKTAKDFEANAPKSGYNAVELLVSPSTTQLGGQFGGIKDSRKAIKWAFDTKKTGSVSPIFSDNNDVLIAVALDNIYDGEYMPYDYPEIKEMLTQRVMNSKKGDDLVKQYQGKATDLNGYAAAMSVQIDTARVSFAANNNPKLPNETGLIGRMAVAKPGTLQGPWKGESAVYVYQVVNQEKEERQPSKEELDNRYAQTRGAQIFANPRGIYQILSKAKGNKVKKNLIKFF